MNPKERHSCDKHGDYERELLGILPNSGREFWTRCPKCSSEQDAEHQRLLAEQQQADLARRIAEDRRRRIEHANIPPRYADTTFADFVVDAKAKQAALDAAIRMVEEEEIASGIFSGRVGTGKTMLACALGNYLLTETSCSVRYETERGLIRRIRDTWRDDAEQTESQVLQKLARVDLLIIDDIGTSHGGEAEKVQLFDVIDSRYRLGAHQTVIVTNLDRKALAAHLGDRIYDRLRESGLWVPFDWESARGRKPRKVVNIKDGSSDAA